MEEASRHDPVTCNYPGWVTSLSGKTGLSTSGNLSNWSAQSLQRDERTGRFADKKLYEILHTAGRQRAYSAIGEVPALLSIFFHRQALGDERDWKTCSFNEFRKLYGLKRMSMA